MNRKTYYKLLEEYQDLISRKHFNPYLCERSRLDELKKRFGNEPGKFLRVRAIDAEEHAKHFMLGSSALLWVESEVGELERLVSLAEKIESEVSVEKADYEGTYYEAKFIAGLTLPQFLIVLLVSVAIYLIYWFLNH